MAENNAPTVRGFRKFDGTWQTLTMSPEDMRIFPYKGGDDLIGFRKRSAMEVNLECHGYALVTKSRTLKSRIFQGLLHWACAEGVDPKGRWVYSWVSGLPDTKGGSGPFVIYSTFDYMRNLHPPLALAWEGDPQKQKPPQIHVPHMTPFGLR